MLQVDLPGIQEGDTGIPPISHHLKSDGGCGSEALGIGYGRGSGL